jgi:hypothetical protein
VLNRLRKRLNYANIVATAALFMGLGGVGYAATASKNSVRSSSIVDRQVKNQDIALNAITTGRIRNGNVANADLATNAVSSVKIANGTIGVADLSAAAQTTALHATGPAEVTLDQPALKEAASLTLPSAGTYVVFADTTLFGSDPTSLPTVDDHAAVDVLLAAGGSAIKSENVQFNPDVLSGANDVATYPWEHVAVINATTPLNVTLSAKPAAGNQATDLKLRTARLVAVRINSATDSTIVP